MSDKKNFNASFHVDWGFDNGHEFNRCVWNFLNELSDNTMEICDLDELRNSKEAQRAHFALAVAFYLLDGREDKALSIIEDHF